MAGLVPVSVGINGVGVPGAAAGEQAARTRHIEKKPAVTLENMTMIIA
jgi:hypothetical protein